MLSVGTRKLKDTHHALGFTPNGINMVTAHIKVTGMVQGVGYRYFALQEANMFGLNGFVKNKPDGSVEMQVEGEKEVIEKFKLILMKGPRFSNVESVKIEYDSYGAKFNKFSVEY